MEKSIHQDTSKYIWDYRFKVRIPQVFAYSEDHIKTFGTYSTLDKDIDKALMNQPFTTFMNIAEMVEKFKEGATISVVNREDIKTIYEYISYHLTAWKDQLKSGLNIGDAPIEDLIDLDNFANTVYDCAKYQIVGDPGLSKIFQQIRSQMTITPTNFLTSLSQPLSLVETEGRVKINPHLKEDKLPKRESLADMLKDHLIQSKLI
jgi:hypothetical protein